LNETLKIPIGLINTSWGGTIAEAWTSAESLNKMTDFQQAVQTIQEHANEQISTKHEDNLKEWNRQITAEDKGFSKNTPHWAESKFNDSNWANMKLPVSWEKADLADFDGIVWFRKTVSIPDHWAGKELVLSLGTIDDNDITYFNGEKIGSTDGYSVERVYIIPHKLVKRGEAVITVRVTDTSGDGGINGDKNHLYLALKSTKEASSVSLAGDWKYQPSVDLKHFPGPQNPNNPNRPTVLFNAMINPLVPYAIQGAIWYQGESNASRAAQYKELFPLMITDWRNAWGRDFPFYFVQLANFMEQKSEPGESAWAELREAQLQTLSLANTGMAVTIDIG
jgi:sialate O-acetylesterase